MDREELKKNIAKYYKKLPAKAQAMFSGLVWLEKINSIADQYGVGQEEAQDLATETMLALLAIISMDEYEYFIMNNINMEKSRAYAMLVEIDKAIFANMRIELMDIYDINSKETDDVGEKEDEGIHVAPPKDELSENLDFIISGGKQ